jgi:hypothetical protein
MNDELESICMETVVTKSKHYSYIFLDEITKAMTYLNKYCLCYAMRLFMFHLSKHSPESFWLIKCPEL